MIFKNLQFRGFMPFREAITLPLDRCGLVLVTGENRVSVSADSNGVGKTSIFDALSWVLFGQTLRGLRADDVICRFVESECEVVLEFENPSITPGLGFRIVRGRRPNVFFLQSDETSEEECRRMDAKDTQSAIEAHLGFGFQTFKNAVIFGQGAFDRFALADQSEQMKMLDEIQGLSFKDALERAKRWRDVWREKVQDLEEQLGQQQVTITVANQQRIALEEARKMFEGGQVQRIRAIEARIKSLQNDLIECKQKVERGTQAAAEYKKVSATVNKIRTQEKELQKALQEATGEVSLAEMALRQVESEQQKIQRQVEELFRSKKCPTCRRVTVGGSSEKEIQAEFAPDIQALAQKYTQAARHVGETKAQLSKVKGQVAKIPNVDELNRKLVELELLAREGATAQRNIESFVQAVKNETGTLAKERSSRFEGEAALGNLEKTLTEARGEIKKIENDLAIAANTIRVAEYWVEAFGDRGLRSLLFDSVAEFLNSRLWYHLNILTSSECFANVSALKPLKSGRIKEELSLALEWKWGAGSYKGGSAGQDRRIDLALFAALQDVAESRTAHPFPIKVWDEPGDALDSRGREIFCRWISEQARERGTGFLVTHSEEIRGLIEPDQIWNVVLDKGGAHVEISGTTTRVKPLRDLREVSRTKSKRKN